MSLVSGFLYLVLPYVCLTIFILGHIWRWRYDQFGWTSYSSELQERSWLRWGSPLFHYGAFAAIAGHIMGLLIPRSWTEAIGISDHVYHLFAAWGGAVAAVMVLVGMGILASRRLFSPRVRATTIPVDWVALISLGIVVVLGIIATIGNLVYVPYDYRRTISPWFRGLFWLHPHGTPVTGAPIHYQLHAITAWILFAMWPFTRLVHAWSIPLAYLWRPYVVYRSRRAAPPNEPGTGKRKWARYSARY